MEDGSAITLAARTGTLPLSTVGSVLRLGDSDGVITLAPGRPAPETFPESEVANIITRLLSCPGLLQYGDPEGFRPLKDWIAADQSRRLARSIAPSSVVLTHGSQQALDLICKALVDPGDAVLVDRPTYVGALQVFNLFQAHVMTLPIAADSHLERLHDELAKGLRPKFLYIVPNFANPTGLTLSRYQRQELASLALKYGFLIVEDDPYGDLHYDTDNTAPAPIAAASTDAIIRLGSFSKILFPAARVGYVVAGSRVTEVLNKLKEAADLGNSAILERIVYELVCIPDFLETHVADVRKVYRERRDVLADSLRNSLNDRFSFDLPQGGFFIWGSLTQNSSASVLLGEALREKVSFVPGNAFYASDPDDRTLRLSFSSATPEQLALASERLGTALRRVAR